MPASAGYRADFCDEIVPTEHSAALMYQKARTMERSRLDQAGEVLQECFWGEYTLSARDIVDRLDNEEPGFDRFLFSKIIENSRHPSRHIRTLFAPERIQPLLQEYMQKAGRSRRVRLVAANLSGQYRLAPEYAWRKH